MRTLLRLFIVVFLLSCSTAESGSVSDKTVLGVREGRNISFARMIEDVKKIDLVFVGEVHDIPDHHLMELEIIRALHESGVPLAIGLEMFRADSQKGLDEWVHGALSLDKFLPVYYDNWRVPWPLYRDIFSYAREHRIPLVGLNIPDKIAQNVAEKGFASLTRDEKKHLPPGISCDIDPTYMDFIRKAYTGHARHVDKRFLNFCEAQMVWDKSMAWHLIGFLKKHPGTTVIVLTGVGHAWKRGIPEQIARESKYTFKVIMPLVPDQIEQDSVTIEDADYVMLQ
ncbi:MAG: ChaN family lipoprotein [Betaproteobacteria bacterium]